MRGVGASIWFKRSVDLWRDELHSCAVVFRARVDPVVSYVSGVQQCGDFGVTVQRGRRVGRHGVASGRAWGVFAASKSLIVSRHLQQVVEGFPFNVAAS